MDDSPGGGTRKNAAEELILRTIAAHADSLLRSARRHSICIDDAQDAYQRAIELFMRHASRLDAARAPGWLHVVVKREAQAIAKARRKLVLASEVDLDGRVAWSLPTPEEQLLSLDMVGRSAEALKRLKPHELRALWLRAQGHSYGEISAITGWSYTKVNRCLSEGRRHFLEQYAGIESGEECERWLPVLSAMVDGEASVEEVLELRPHLRNCPGCRATLRALQDSTTPLAALLPVPLVVVDSGVAEHVVQVLVRVYEGLAGGLHERAVNSLTKAHAVIEASAAGKVAAVAASAAAVAGGGYVSVEQIAERPASALLAPIQASGAALSTAAWTSVGRVQAVVAKRSVQSSPVPRALDSPRPPARITAAPEFRAAGTAFRARAQSTFTAATTTSRGFSARAAIAARPARQFSARGPGFAP